jgi:tetratricopeptide (TPR) repeat protein
MMGTTQAHYYHIVPQGLRDSGGVILYDARSLEEAKRTAAVSRELKQKELEARALLNSGKTLHEAGRVKEAIAQYELAIDRDANLAETEFYLGLAWNDLGDLDQARAHCERSLLLDPKNSKCESNLGGVLVAKGLRTEARRRYEHSLSLNPNLEIAHKELGDILCSDGEYDSAISHYEEALRLKPDFAAAKQNLNLARTITKPK